MRTFPRHVALSLVLFVSIIGHAVEVDQEAVRAAKDAFVDRMVTTHGFERVELTRILDNAEIDEQIL